MFVFELKHGIHYSSQLTIIAWPMPNFVVGVGARELGTGAHGWTEMYAHSRSL